MNLEQFIEITIQKVGKDEAFKIADKIRMNALENLLVEKGILTKQEITEAQNESFDKYIQTIHYLPDLK